MYMLSNQLISVMMCCNFTTPVAPSLIDGQTFLSSTDTHFSFLNFAFTPNFMKFCLFFPWPLEPHVLSYCLRIDILKASYGSWESGECLSKSRIRK